MKIERTQPPRPRPAADKLGFGLHFTDHILRMDFDRRRRGQPDNRPYAPHSLDPTACVLYYGQTIFEGMKAYRGTDADPTPRLFRPDMHALRWNASADRLCMPRLEPQQFVDCVKAIIRTDADWMPQGEGTSLYV